MTQQQLRAWASAPHGPELFEVTRAVLELLADRDDLKRRALEGDAYVTSLRTDLEVRERYVHQYEAEHVRLREELARLRPPAPWEGKTDE